MLKQFRAFRERLRDRRAYEALMSKLERINSEDVTSMDHAVVPQGIRQVLGGGRR